jgi:ArsR family transcriptional regulator
MAFSKAPNFPEPLYKESILSKARAHPARIIILNYLLDNGTTSFKDLCRLISLAKTTVSQHLRMLRRDHFIEAEERFPYTYYTINKKYYEELVIMLSDYKIQFTVKEQKR